MQIIPPNVRRQQVVFVHPQERQLRPTIEAGTSIKVEADELLIGQLRVERIRRGFEGLGVGEEEMKPLSELGEDECSARYAALGLTGGVRRLIPSLECVLSAFWDALSRG